MPNQVKVDIIADAAKFEASMKRAEMASKSFQDTLTKTASESDKLESAFGDVANSVDESESTFMGTADLLDGLATTMGLNVSGAIEMSRGFADMASGITQTVTPAVQGLSAKLKALGTGTGGKGGKGGSGTGIIGGLIGGLAASAAGLVALGLAAGAAGFGVVALAKNTEFLNNPIGTLLNGVEQIGQKLHLLDTAPASVQILQLTRTLDKAGKAAFFLADGMGQVQKTSGLDSLGPPAGVPTAQLGRLAEWQGVMASTSAGGWERIVPYEAPPDPKQPAKSAAKIKKNVEDVAKKALNLAFDKVEPKLKAAKDKFDKRMAKATSLRDTFKAMFKLDFGTDIGHNVVEGIRRQVAQFEKFTAKIQQLRKAGLRESLVRQFAAAGPGALDEMNRINSGNLAEINRLAKQGEKSASTFARNETIRQTGTDPNKPVPVKLTLDVKGDDLKNLIKKWVRTEGGGDVQVAFGKAKK